jgi:hypothetical protein
LWIFVFHFQTCIVLMQSSILRLWFSSAVAPLLFSLGSPAAEEERGEKVPGRDRGA